MTRVLLVLGTSAGGVGRHVRSLADGLLARGHEVMVAAPAATQDLFALPGHVAVEVGARPDVARDARAVRRLRALAAEADVVHAHGLRAAALAALARGPLVSTLHNEVPGRLGRLLGRLVARRSAVVLTVSPDLHDWTRALGARDVRDCPVGAPLLPPPHRTREQVRAELGVPDGAPLLLAVGRLHHQKGLDVLLDAGLPGCVAVAGDGPLREELHRRGPGVRWLGRRDDLADLYAAADVVVLPSRWEGRPLTAQEVLRAGRPLVATAVGGVPALVGDGALLVPAQDPVALREAVTGLLADTAAALALAARGRARADTWPTEDELVDQVAALYAEVVR